MEVRKWGVPLPAVRSERSREEDERRRARISDAWLTPRGRRIQCMAIRLCETLAKRAGLHLRKNTQASCRMCPDKETSSKACCSACKQARNPIRGLKQEIARKGGKPHACSMHELKKHLYVDSRCSRYAWIGIRTNHGRP